MLKSVFSPATICISLALSAQSYAAPVNYQPTIIDPTSMTTFSGSVGKHSWNDEIGSEINFWIINVTAATGSLLDISVNRSDIDMDPAFSLYRGLTSADDSAFENEDDWGGLTFLESADDEIPHAGPYGDPYLNIFLAQGVYTLAIGDYASTDNVDGPFTYSVGVSEVPLPGAAWLFGSAMLGLASRKAIAS